MDLVNIFIRSAFVDNMIFAFFFGMCSYLAVSKTVKTAVGLGMAVIFVLVVTVPINYLIESYILKEGALSWLGDQYKSIDLSYLTFIMFIAVIASTVQLVEMIVEKISPALYGALGIFLPLIAVNCAILGGSLFMQERAYNSMTIAFNKTSNPLTDFIIPKNKSTNLFSLMPIFCLAKFLSFSISINGI